MPVLSADQPSTCCTYSVSMKKFAKMTAPSRKPDDVGAEHGADRGRCRTASAARSTRISITMKIARGSPTEAIRAGSFAPSAQPTSGAFEIA